MIKESVTKAGKAAAGADLAAHLTVHASQPTTTWQHHETQCYTELRFFLESCY
jgi:hypothetical protein